MKLPRDLYGDELARHLVRLWDYRMEAQRGSHIILVTEVPLHHRLPVPAHKPLSAGTLRAVIAEVCQVKQVSRDDVLRDL